MTPHDYPKQQESERHFLGLRPVMNQFDQKKVKSALRRFGSFDDPSEKQVWSLPFDDRVNWRYMTSGYRWRVEVDGWTDKPTIWLIGEGQRADVLSSRRLMKSKHHLVPNYGHLSLLRPDGNKLRVVRKFADDVARNSIPLMVELYHRGRLNFNPGNGRLYVAESDNAANYKSFSRVYEVDPGTGKVRVVDLPFHAEDMCFDLNGLAYLRTVNVVGRYDPKTWREMPWDYGEERSGVGFGWMSGMKKGKLISALMLPSNGNWHHGGMHVSARGHLVVGCLLGFSTRVKTNAKCVHKGRKFTQKVFPGIMIGSGGRGSTVICIFDRHGKTVFKDAVPGMADVYGVAIDREDNIYTMSSATRCFDGKRYYNKMTGTLMKLVPDKSRVLTSSKKAPIPLPKEQYPKRPIDVSSAQQGEAWVENAEWLFGGVGFGGRNAGGCACWNARFAHDYLGRSFAPEMDRYSVAVLDSSGNVITRIGTYGNVDDGKPLIADGGPAKSRSIGGDETALYHAPYLATHTDKRLFIADPGNERILSVKLGYSTSESVKLGKAADNDSGGQRK